MTNDNHDSSPASATTLLQESVSSLAQRVFELNLLVSRLARALSLFTAETGLAAQWRGALVDATIQEKVISLEIAMKQRDHLEELQAPAMIIEDKEQDVALLQETIVGIKEAAKTAPVAADLPCTQVYAEGIVDDLLDLSTSFAGSAWPILYCDGEYRRRLLSR